MYVCGCGQCFFIFSLRQTEATGAASAMIVCSVQRKGVNVLVNPVFPLLGCEGEERGEHEKVYECVCWEGEPNLVTGLAPGPSS